MRNLCTIEPFYSALKAHGIKSPSDLPLGAIVGEVTVAECLDTDAIANTLTPAELAFGDFRPGRWAWHCTGPTQLVSPIDAKARSVYLMFPTLYWRKPRELLHFSQTLAATAQSVGD